MRLETRMSLLERTPTDGVAAAAARVEKAGRAHEKADLAARAAERELEELREVQVAAAGVLDDARRELLAEHAVRMRERATELRERAAGPEGQELEEITVTVFSSKVAGPPAYERELQPASRRLVGEAMKLEQRAHTFQIHVDAPTPAEQVAALVAGLGDGPEEV